LPFCEASAVKASVVEVAPAMFVKLAPPSMLCCHCTVGVGDPVAAAVKVTVCPAFAVTFVGFNVIVGALFTVSEAAVVVAEPVAFVNTARNWFPFCEASAVKASVVEVAPAMFVKVAPPSMLCCHCTVRAGDPVAAAVKVAVCPAFTVTFTGFSVIVGALFTVSKAAVVVAEPLVLLNTAR